MTVQFDFSVGNAPEITPSGVSDIITKLAPFAFESGLTVTMCATFPRFLEKVIFTLEFTDEDQSASDAGDFLAAVRANQDRLATRLAEARYNARLTREDTPVSLDGIRMAPEWPQLIMSAGPYNPDATDDKDDR